MSDWSARKDQTLEKVEKLLLIWMNEMQLVGDSILETRICEKAKYFHQDLLKKTPGTCYETDVYKASQGWFEKFKKQTCIHSVVPGMD